MDKCNWPGVTVEAVPVVNFGVVTGVGAFLAALDSDVHRSRELGRFARGERRLIQTVAAVLLALRGVIHLIGFVVLWRIATIQGYPLRTTALELGDLSGRFVGLVRLVLAMGFVAAGSGAKGLGIGARQELDVGIPTRDSGRF